MYGRIQYFTLWGGGGEATLVAEGGKPSTEVFLDEKACKGTKELGPAREEAPKTFVCRSATGK